MLSIRATPPSEGGATTEHTYSSPTGEGSVMLYFCWTGLSGFVFVALYYFARILKRSKTQVTNFGPKLQPFLQCCVTSIRV